MTVFADDVSNKAFIVSDRCETGTDSQPTNSSTRASSWAENRHQPSSNINVASQRLNNLRLNTYTHLCTINQMRMCQPTIGFLGWCLQTVYVHQTLPVWVSGNISSPSEDERLGGATSSNTSLLALSCLGCPLTHAFYEPLLFKSMTENI